MFLNPTRRRSLLAMTSATAGLAAILTPSAAQAVVDGFLSVR